MVVAYIYRTVTSEFSRHLGLLVNRSSRSRMNHRLAQGVLEDPWYFASSVDVASNSNRIALRLGLGNVSASRHNGCVDFYVSHLTVIISRRTTKSMIYRSRLCN